MKIDLVQPDDPWTKEHQEEYKKIAKHVIGCGQNHRGCAPGCILGMLDREYKFGYELGYADAKEDLKDDQNV